MVNKDLKKNSKIRTVNMMIQSALIIILIVLVANMMVEIKNLQGTARVINYAGLVIGATQRVVKLEVIGNSDDELIEYLDDVLAAELAARNVFEDCRHRLAPSCGYAITNISPIGKSPNNSASVPTR